MEKKLQRIEQDQMIAGVCTGLAEYFDVDVTWVRIAFVIAVMAGASGILAYIVLWIAVPKRPYLPDYGQFNADYKVYEQASQANPANSSFIKKKKGNGQGRLIAGTVFIFFGLFFLLNEFNLIPYWLDFHTLWPMILIIMGLYILAGSKKRQSWKDDWNNTGDFGSSTANDTETPNEVSPNTDQKQN